MFFGTEYCVRRFTQFMEEWKQFILSRQEVRGVKLRGKKEGVAQLKTSTPEINRAISIAVGPFYKHIKTTIILII